MVNNKNKSIMVKDGIRLYRVSRSPYWWVSIRSKGQEIRKSTKEVEPTAASQKAIEIATEIKVKLEHGLSLRAMPRFIDIAGQIIRSLESTNYGKANDKSVIRALEHYLIPCLGKMPVNRVSRVEIHKFYLWRQEKTGSEISPTQKSNTVIALKRVFDLACDQGHIRQADIPSLPKINIKKSKPRDYFEPPELRKLFSQKNFDGFIGASRNKVTRTYRQIFPYYITFLLFTGVRPGQESAHLQYKDFKFVKHDGDIRCTANISKGKTIRYSSGREIFVDEIGVRALRHPAVYASFCGGLKTLDELVKAYPDKYVFRAYLEEQESKAPDFTRIMEQYMSFLGLGDANHTLYSLRHTYITLKLLKSVDAYDIAKQCGTSEAMIEQFYDHVRPIQKAKQLAFRKIEKGISMEDLLSG